MYSYTYIHNQKRKEAKWAQRAKGTVALWEDLHVPHAGEDWRGSRERMTARQWYHNEGSFVISSCPAAGLNMDGHKQKQNAWQSNGEFASTASKQRLTFQGKEPSKDELQTNVDAYGQWSSTRGCFLFVVDSQSLVMAVIGQAYCPASSSHDKTRCIINGLGYLMKAGLTPPAQRHDPVVWRRREFNKVADGLADLTMDRRGGWSRQYTLSKDHSQGNCLAFSDGGKRSSCISAAAWLVVLLFWEDGQWRVEPWAAGGIFLEHDDTVFEAEAVGLEAAVSFLQKSLSE